MTYQNQPQPTDTLFQTYDRSLYKITGQESTDAILDMIDDNNPNANNSSSVTINADQIASGQSTASVNALVNQSFTSQNTNPPISSTQTNAVSTHFFPLQGMNANMIWVSDGTTPNGALSGTKGDLCMNGPSGHLFWCGGGTTWTQI